jgi:probable H4MPT-linked C1 transfer pathway protein
MTAELSDIFENRNKGTKKVINTLCKILPEKKTFFYSNKKHFFKKKEAMEKTNNINSMNWHATANFISNFYPNCILVDVGSSTTDIIPIKKKCIIAKGNDDYKRLLHRELVYIGVIRTPINAIEKEKKLIYENFANLGDVYRILNKLPKKMDLVPSQDKKSKNKNDSARRIARIFGKDYKKNDFNKWKKVALQIEKKQKKILKENINKIKKRNFSNSVPIIGAGIGEFLIKNIYHKNNYFSFYSKLRNIKKINAINCESAISVAKLLNSFLESKRSKF